MEEIKMRQIEFAAMTGVALANESRLKLNIVFKLKFDSSCKCCKIFQ